MEATIATERGDMPVYFAVPEGQGPWPGVLVVPDALGMTTDLRNQADWLADAGYLAAAPDIYYSGGRIQCLFSIMRQALNGQGSFFDDLESVRSWLLTPPDTTDRVGVIGFCLGGGYALLLAGTGGYDAASSNYGGLTKPALASLAEACPIVGSYGALDRSLKKEPKQIAEILGENGIPYDIKVYPDAGHSFMNDHLESEAPKWSIVMGSFVHSEFHQPSAMDARRRIAAFFDTHLAPAR